MGGFEMSLRIWVLAALTVGLLVMMSPSGNAHHSFATFWNTDGHIEITGVMKSARIMNPHSQIVITVTEPGGQPVDWVGTSSSLQGMRQAGYMKSDTIMPGTQVTVAGNPARSEGAKAILINKVTTADGRVFTIRVD
jgi:hypothetical protein